MAGLVLDANVLIDYEEADREILRRASAHWGRLVVTEAVLREVRRLDQGACVELGIEVLTLTDEQAIRAARMAGQARAISDSDATCLLAALDLGLTCVTNDKPLRVQCEEHGAPVLWGLELALKLVRAGEIRGVRAEEAGRRIHQSNPHITEELLLRYLNRLRNLGPG